MEQELKRAKKKDRTLEDDWTARPVSSTRNHSTDLDMKWPRYDVIMAPDGWLTNLTETCQDVDHVVRSK